VCLLQKYEEKKFLIQLQGIGARMKQMKMGSEQLTIKGKLHTSHTKTNIRRLENQLTEKPIIRLALHW
jgi:hypothetical protein